jgi:hypothetical protein
MNPLPKDMTTETPLTDQKWIWGTGMDGSPIEVVSAEFARRLEMDRARLKKALRFYADRDLYEGAGMDSFSLAECDRGETAREALSELERNEK